MRERGNERLYGNVTEMLAGSGDLATEPCRIRTATPRSKDTRGTSQSVKRSNF